MEGIISGMKSMEIHDGDGLRTTVFFKGCSLRCIWCHNPESISFAPQTAFFEEKCIRCGLCGGARDEAAAVACPVEAMTVYGKRCTAQELVEEVLRDAPFFREGGGVTLSGGECLMQPQFAAETARLLSQQGISVYIDTCGHVERAALDAVLPYTDKFLYDVKAADPQLHRRLTGAYNEKILANLRYLSEQGCRIEIRYPFVVGCNDGEVDAIGALLQPLRGIEKVKVLRYHNFAASRYRALGMENTLPPDKTTAEAILSAAARLRTFGLNAVTE